MKKNKPKKEEGAVPTPVNPGTEKTRRRQVGNPPVKNIKIKDFPGRQFYFQL